MAVDALGRDRDEVAERLAPLAQELTQRIRLEPVEVLWSELLTRLDTTSGAALLLDLGALVMLLAAADDPHRDPEIKWGWVRFDIPRLRRRARQSAPAATDLNEQVRDLATAGVYSDTEIGRRTGLSPRAVAARRSRMEPTRPGRVAGRRARSDGGGVVAA